MSTPISSSGRKRKLAQYSYAFKYIYHHKIKFKLSLLSISLCALFAQLIYLQECDAITTITQNTSSSTHLLQERAKSSKHLPPRNHSHAIKRKILLTRVHDTSELVFKSNRTQVLNATEQMLLSAEEALEAYEKTADQPIKDCSSLFPKCLCSFQESVQRNFLYCNDPSVTRMPDFRSILDMFERYIKTVHSKLNLIFSKVDFSG